MGKKSMRMDSQGCTDQRQYYKKKEIELYVRHEPKYGVGVYVKPISKLSGGIMDDEIRYIKCLECGNEQPDMGKNVECEECGAPMPESDYEY